MQGDALEDSDLIALRRTRWALRAEMDRVLHWRRLIKARIDLSVAAALLPEPICQEPFGPIPAGHENSLPPHDVLAQLVRGSSTTADVFQIGELRRVELELSNYCDSVRRDLEYTTDRLVLLLTQDPYSAIAQLTSAP